MGRLVGLLDGLALILIVLAALIVGTDGFVLHVWSMPIRLRTVDRTLIWLAAVVCVRMVINRRALPFGMTGVTARAMSSSLFIPSAVEGLRVGPASWRAPHFRTAAVLMAAAIGVLLHAQVAHLYSVPDRGDPLFSMWRMGWVTHQLMTDPAHLFDANIFYPDRLTLAFSDPMILPAVMHAPFAAIGQRPNAGVY